METKELIILKEKLDNDLLSFSEAFELLKKSEKPWKTDEWRSKREKVIKDFCEVCETKEGPFYILNHDLPRAFSDIRYSYIQEIKEDLIPRILEHMEKTGFKSFVQSEKRLACPTCQFLTFRERKTMLPRYKCSKNHEFDEPIEVNYYALARTTDLDIAETIAKSDKIKEILNKYISDNRPVIDKLALSESLSLSIQYWKFENINTVCKKCSYLERKHLIEIKSIKNLESNLKFYDN